MNCNLEFFFDSPDANHGKVREFSYCENVGTLLWIDRMSWFAIKMYTSKVKLIFSFVINLPFRLQNYFTQSVLMFATWKWCIKCSSRECGGRSGYRRTSLGSSFPILEKWLNSMVRRLYPIDSIWLFSVFYNQLSIAKCFCVHCIFSILWSLSQIH